MGLTGSTVPTQVETPSIAPYPLADHEMRENSIVHLHHVGSGFTSVAVCGFVEKPVRLQPPMCCGFLESRGQVRIGKNLQRTASLALSWKCQKGTLRKGTLKFHLSVA